MLSFSKKLPKVEATADINEKEDLYAEIDKIEGSIDGKIEEVLLEILPEAFAVVKETARRFTENEKIEVTASQMDRDIAAARDSVEIIGEKHTGILRGMLQAPKLSGTWYITMFS